jgi:hypothetical protein
MPSLLPSCSFPTLALTGRALSLGDRHSCSLPPSLRSLPSPSRSMPPALALVAPRPRAHCPPPSCSMPAALAFDTCLPRGRKPAALALDARISRAFPPPSRLMPPALAVLVLASLRPRIRFPPLLCLLPAALEFITRRPRPLALVTRRPRPLALVTRRPRPLPCPRPAHDCHPIRVRCPPPSRSLLAARVPFRACARWPPPACSVLDPRPMCARFPPAHCPCSLLALCAPHRLFPHARCLPSTPQYLNAPSVSRTILCCNFMCKRTIIHYL